MWHIEKINEPFISKNGFTLPTTVRTQEITEEGDVLSTMDYGYGEIEWLSLHCKDPNFSLNGLYFKDFSIRDFIFLNMDSIEEVPDFCGESCFFEGDTDFGEMTFTGNKFSLAQSKFVNGKVVFRASIFNVDIVDMNNISFDEGIKDFSSCTFLSREVNFYGANFSDGTLDFRIVRVPKARLSFSGSTFGNGKVVFDFSVFNKEGMDFSGVQFGDVEMTFRNTNFESGNILFFGTGFGNGLISFGGAKIRNANLDFSFCHYKKCEIRFRHTIFGFGKLNFNGLETEGGKIIFEACEFRGKNMSFSESVLGEIGFNRCTFAEHVDMTVKSCDSLILNNCIVEKAFDMAASHKRKVHIGKLNILHTKNLGQIDIDWRYNKVLEMINSQGDETSFQDKANQFRLLKENFRNLGRYTDEDEAYVAFKRCEGWARIYDPVDENIGNSRRTRIKNRLAYPFKWLVLDYIGHYATNPFRILGAMFISIFIFTILYSMPFVFLQGEKEFFYVGNIEWVHDILKALYHSIATNFTIGYGDVNPGNIIAMIFSGIQGFFGLFFMSYFTVAFVRKILR